MLDGKTVLITGGTSGIGLAMARRFAREGAQVVISGRSREMLDEAVAQIGEGAIGLQGDVADLRHHAAAAREMADRFDGLDIYVANAGINAIRPSAEVSESDYDSQFAINARGAFFGVQKMVPVMRDGGAILVTGSIASEKVLDGHAVYAGTKAALGAFVRSWAIELKHRRIRVNMLSPGPTDTAILDKLGVPADQRPSFEAAMAAAIPLGRLGRPEELAAAALFLVSDAGSFVTGMNLRVDGGMTLA
ncbi:MAG TPA: glucose 1-dehydrogenase [Allosphingosinicella sp.]|nr:glucose 1-dehydrogenase [Allosphingosinicella sp.]